MGACLNKGNNIIIKSEMENLGTKQFIKKLNIKKRESTYSLEYEIPKINQKDISLTTLSSNDISSEINLNEINSIYNTINNNTVKEIMDAFQ